MPYGIAHGVGGLTRIVAAGLGALAALIISVGAFAQSTRPEQPRFSSAEDATAALVQAARGNRIATLVRLLGPEGRKLVVSGDPVQDRHGREIFVTAFEESHRIEMTSSEKATLIVGAANWPFPIPLVHEDGGWRFDTESGTKEILDRRIGRNELSAMEVCQAYVAAQREYAARDWGASGRHEFARKFVSTAGKKDGLYWRAKADEEASPLGPLVARARAEGYTARTRGERAPYHGYLYRILTKQGKSAPGGALNYMVDGHMTRGFALLAFPAEYGDSGIMSLIVNQDGTVYQKDLGPQTGKLAPRMTEFDPGEGWNAVQTK